MGERVAWADIIVRNGLSKQNWNSEQLCISIDANESLVYGWFTYTIS